MRGFCQARPGFLSSTRPQVAVGHSVLIVYDVCRGVKASSCHGPAARTVQLATPWQPCAFAPRSPGVASA
eukprot:8158436-Alexandrium_andersonii.AAC.1